MLARLLFAGNWPGLRRQSFPRSLMRPVVYTIWRERRRIRRAVAQALAAARDGAAPERRDGGVPKFAGI